jgi:hypothetical protein
MAQKNIIERFIIQQIKDNRTALMIIFHVKQELERQHVSSNWIKMFILYLHMKTDMIKLMEFLMQK